MSLYSHFIVHEMISLVFLFLDAITEFAFPKFLWSSQFPDQKPSVTFVSQVKYKVSGFLIWIRLLFSVISYCFPLQKFFSFRPD